MRAQVFAQLSAFVVAAFETTVSAATTSLLYVAAHPRVQARVAAELSALQGAGSTSTTSGSSGGGCSGWQLAASDLEQVHTRGQQHPAAVQCERPYTLYCFELYCTTCYHSQ
jgi:cytochrome P450